MSAILLRDGRHSGMPLLMNRPTCDRSLNDRLLQLLLQPMYDVGGTRQGVLDNTYYLELLG